MVAGRNMLTRFVRRAVKIIINFLQLQIACTLIALLIGAFLPYKPFEFSNFAKEALKGDTSLFTKEQLAQCNGENGQPLYLALLGSVYDVSKGIKHYGPGCAYNFFVGRDASVSFINGEFEHFDPEIADDVIGQLKVKDLLGLANWQHFYDKDYVYKGKLIGRFYDEHGLSTKYHHRFSALVAQAKEEKAETEQLQTLYPDCNVQWSEENGTRVWCTQSSGGKERAWIGYPRKFFQVGSDRFRCACIKEDDLQTTQVMIKEYDNCDPRAYECFYRID